MGKSNESETITDDKNLTHEIVIGLVAGAGTNVDKVVNELKSKIKPTGYDIEQIHVSKLLTNIKKFTPRNSKNEIDRIRIGIDKCNNFREEVSKRYKKSNPCYKKQDAMAILAVAEIRRKRKKTNNNGIIYIIRQLKNPSEIKTLRKIYGKNFIVISVYDHKENRKSYLASKIPEISIKRKEAYLKKIDKIIDDDEKQEMDFGQNTRGAFVEGDYFISMKNLSNNIVRFTNILFGYLYHTPTKDELNMAYAWTAAARSSDLARQVGAIITDKNGNIVASSCNDVPKWDGGMYWEGDIPDDRDFQKGCDPNDCEKKMLIKDFIDNIIEYVPEIKKLFKKNLESTKDNIYKILKDKKAEIFCILEYHRAVHAEDGAICDAARRGISIQGATIYCTTFPCHLCTKHIIAVGINRVVYIHPYPKSRAQKLFNDMVDINPTKKCNNKIIYEPFIGVAPRRLLKVFLYDADFRKHDGKKIDWDINGQVSPFLANRTPLAYYDKETAYIYSFYREISDLIKTELKDIFINAENEFSNYEPIKQKWANSEVTEIIEQSSCIDKKSKKNTK